MSLENHLQELTSRHQQIEQVLREEQRRPSADSIKLSKLKREKLRLKEEIQSLKEKRLS